jgi:hypothetical protein
MTPRDKRQSLGWIFLALTPDENYVRYRELLLKKITRNLRITHNASERHCIH